MMNELKMVPRIEDLPYLSSPPIEFVYQSTANISAGSYTWADLPNLLVPNRPLMENSVYYFRSITLAANADELDFTSNLTTIPTFQMYLKSRAKAILFREPIYMPKYLQNFDYRFAWVTQRSNDTIYASFNGVLKQGSTFIGKLSVTLTAIISAQEVVDEGFVKKFRESYPAGGYNG
jgi:hypothetical protein